MLSQSTLPEYFLIGCDHSAIWPTQRGVTVLYTGHFCKNGSTAGVRALRMTFTVRKPLFHVVKYLAEHWNKLYLCLQAGFSYLQNRSKTTNSSSLVSWTCLAYLVAVSASNHPAFPISYLQEWPSKAKLNQVWTKLRRLFPPVLNTWPSLLSVFSVKLLLQKGMFLYFFVLLRHKFDLLN